MGASKYWHFVSLFTLEMFLCLGLRIQEKLALILAEFEHWWKTSCEVILKINRVWVSLKSAKQGRVLIIRINSAVFRCWWSSTSECRFERLLVLYEMNWLVADIGKICCNMVVVLTSHLGLVTWHEFRNHYFILPLRVSEFSDPIHSQIRRDLRLTSFN